MLGKRLLLFVFLPILTKNIDIGACVQKMLVASEYLSFLALLFFVLYLHSAIQNEESPHSLLSCFSPPCLIQFQASQK